MVKVSLRGAWVAGWLARWERTQLVTVLRGFVGPRRRPLAPRALWENAAGPSVKKKYQNAPQWKKKKKAEEGGEVGVVWRWWRGLELDTTSPPQIWSVTIWDNWLIREWACPPGEGALLIRQ